MTADRKEAQAHGIKLPVAVEPIGGGVLAIFDAYGCRVPLQTIAAALNATQPPAIPSPAAASAEGETGEYARLADEVRDYWHASDEAKKMIIDALRFRVQSAARIAELEARLKEANEVLRSAYQIAARRGAETNWPAFMARLESELKAQLTLRASPPAGRK